MQTLLFYQLKMPQPYIYIERWCALECLPIHCVQVRLSMFWPKIQFLRDLGEVG